MKIKFIGDLSIEDARVLFYFATKSKSILEFGAGGSTQIFAQCKPDNLVTVETDANWVELTKKRLEKLTHTEITHPKFVEYNCHPRENFDMIFVDGIDCLRREFAINTWSLLAIGGFMVFHDTRRAVDFENMCHMSQKYFNEIDTIDVNINNSNLTAVKKKNFQPWVNWNHSEGKPLWAYGGITETQDKDLWELDLLKHDNKN